MRMMLKGEELQKLRGRCEEDNGKWVVPAFYVREKEVVLPRIRNAMALVED